MNHLAHAWLTPGMDPFELAGNVLGDYFLADKLSDLSAPVRRGFQLHQRIDRFADHHPDYKKARELISPERRRYAPVLLDVYFDLYLAEIWTTSEELPGYLKRFTDHVSEQLLPVLPSIPLRYPDSITRMVKAQWLDDYTDQRRVRRVFHGLSRRARPGNPLEGAETEYYENAQAFEPAFQALFKDLKNEIY